MLTIFYDGCMAVLPTHAPESVFIFKLRNMTRNLSAFNDEAFFFCPPPKKKKLQNSVT